MELRHLHYFVTLAGELHFGRAAEKVFVAQSTLSQQIQAFEEELDVALFQRSKRSVRLTEAGRTLLPYARRVLQEARRAERVAQAAKRGTAGLLRISYEATAMRSGLAEAIKAFRSEAPDVELDLVEQGSRAQAEALRAEAVDVGFVFLPIDERGLRAEAIDEAPTLVVLPEGHRLAGRQRVPLRELSDEPHVMWARDVTPGVFDDYVRACHEAGFAPQVVQEIRHMESLLGLVAAGLGVSTAHRSRAQSHYPGVCYALITEPVIPLKMGVAWRQGEVPAVVARFLKVVHRVTASGVERR